MAPLRARAARRSVSLLLLAGFALLACLPMLAGLTGWNPGAPAKENRTLATFPALPRTLSAFVAFSADLSTYLNDHYGLRSLLVGLDTRLRYQLFGEFVSDQVWLGRHGRLFFISHVAGEPFSLTDRICGTGATPVQVTAAAAGMARLLAEGREITPATYYVSVPISPIVYGEDLPRWLGRRCGQTEPFVPRMQAALAAQDQTLAAHLVYPRAVLNDSKSSGVPYPPWGFHWSGNGAEPVTEFVAGTVLGLPRRTALPVRLAPEPSDLAQFTPGIDHQDLVPVPDHAAAGVSFCYGGGGACGADLAPFGHAINEITRSTSPSGPSLLIISDSFGRMPAQYFCEYFGTVLHLNIAFERLAPGELPALARQVAALGRPDVLLFVFHDAAAIDAGGLAGPFATVAAAFR